MNIFAANAQSEASRKNYRPDIDGMRALAIICVLIFHAFPESLKGGFIGVDIFFVISGYLITGIIHKDLENNNFSFAGFYARRIRRIFPALLTILIITCIFGWFFLLADEYQQLGKYIAAGASFVTNFSLWLEAGYFDNASPTKPLLHLWSLAIEEQFYLFWPLFMCIARKTKINILWATLACLFISFAFNIARIHGHPVGTFYLPSSRMWELFAGSLLSIYQARKSPDISLPRANALKTIFSLLGFGLIIFTALRVTKDDPYPGWFAILPVSGAAILIAVGPGAWLNRRILSQRAFIDIGLISYPLYVWHWPILSFLYILNGDEPSSYQRWAALALSFLLAALTYHFIEKPFRFGSLRPKAVPILLSGLIFIGAIGGLIYAEKGLPSVRHAILSDATEEPSRQWPYASNDTCVQRYPYDDLNRLNFWFCYQTKPGKPTILLLGNSYANDLVPGLSRHPLFKDDTILSIGACFPSYHVFMTVKLVANHPCEPAQRLKEDAFMDKWIEQNKTLRLAFLNAAWPPFDEKGWWGTADGTFVSADTKDPSQTPRDIFMAGLDKRISMLEAHHIRVVLFLPKPELHHDIRDCFNRPFIEGRGQKCKLDRATEAKDFKYFDEAVYKLAKHHPNMIVYDKFDAFCEGNTCDFMPNNRPLLRDDEHLSEYASELLINKFIAWAEKNHLSLSKLN